MSTTEIKIETNQILGDFKSHLDIDNNNRILFSGPFGTGKSTFLNDFTAFFEDEYYVVKIYPVHYSVASNEDVFELIKYDILFHLFNEKEEILKLKKEDFSKFLKAQMFVLNVMKFKPLLYSILELSGKIGTPVVNFIKELNQVYDDFKDYDKETKIDEKQLIKDYLQSIENSPGNIKEYDSNSQLISELLERVKSKNEKLKSVLIIDDLDRLDPEHIFRLFNVFSAHHSEINNYTPESEKNNHKFGFDKVIFVCDVENIRKIFHHRYGSEVDFSGYIDKFYSLTPYDFDSRKYVKESISLLLKKVAISEKLNYYNFETNKRFFDSLKAVVLSLIDAKLLNLRMLTQYPVFSIPELTFKAGKSRTIYYRQSPILVLFYFLRNFYTSFDILHQNLIYLNEKFSKENFKSKTYDYYDNEEDINDLISFCLHFILPSETAFDFYDENSKKFESEDLNCVICYSEYRNYDFEIYFKNFQKAIMKNDTEEESDEKLKVLNPYNVLLIAFENCKKKGLLV